jgi:hypothetical protein
MTNTKPTIVQFPNAVVPDDALDLMDAFSRAGAEGSFIYGGYARDKLGGKASRDQDIAAKFPAPAEGTDAYRFAEDVADAVFDVFHRTTDDVRVVKYRFDDASGLYLARLKFVSQGVEVDALAVAGNISKDQMIHRQVLGADAPINSFVMTDDGKVYGDSRSPGHLRQQLYQAAPNRDANEVEQRFARLKTKYKSLQHVEPDWNWSPPPRLGFSGMY